MAPNINKLSYSTSEPTTSTTAAAMATVTDGLGVDNTNGVSADQSRSTSSSTASDGTSVISSSPLVVTNRRCSIPTNLTIKTAGIINTKASTSGKVSYTYIIHTHTTQNIHT